MTHQTIKSIIIDDEQNGRDILMALLGSFPWVEVVSVCKNAAEAIEALLINKPDLAFIDIELPDQSGLEVVQKVKEYLNTTFIFVSAYDKYALKAIKLEAFDFLVKPVDPDELEAVIKKYQFKKVQNVQTDKLDLLLNQMMQTSKIRLNTRTGFSVVDTNKIIYAIAEGNYTVLNFGKNQHETVTQNIGNLENLLPAMHFIKASRSCLINLNYVRKFDRKNKKCVVGTDDETFAIHVSKNMLGYFDDFLKK